MIAHGATLGVLGGGQLGRMVAMAAHRLGYRVAALDPDRDCPAAVVANIHVCAALDDVEAWDALAGECTAITIETESVPAEALKYFGARMPVAPGERALYITQDRAREKHFLSTNGFATAPYRTIRAPSDAESPGIDALLPGLLKSSRFGYDGKGQHVVRSRQELTSVVQQLGGPGVLEQRVELAAELSVIVARSANGNTAVHPVPLNRHVSGILDLSVAPAPLPQDIDCKSTPRPGRKMGHLTCIADSVADAQSLASRIRSISRPTVAEGYPK